MPSRRCALLCCLLVVNAGSALGQIKTDGTVGAAATLTGPNYTIGPALGRQVGTNLFHSFSTFNLASGEAATFTGPASVANVLARVTGGSPSSINGALRSTIAGANLFLLNPSGLVFGPNAQLDVQGSFHASTADYLGFADRAQFHASNPSQSTFTAAPPAAFGFLSAAPAPIAVNGSQLGVAGGQALSLVGGPITVSGGAFLAADNGGGLNLIAAASPGESALDGTRFTSGSFGRFADISLSGSNLFARNAGPGSGPGSLVIRAANLRLDSSSTISSGDNAPSIPTDIALTDDLVLVNGSGISSGQFSSTGSGSPGPISISARNIRIVDGSILSTNFGVAAGGNITLSAQEGISITRTPGFADLAVVSTGSGGEGRAGNVAIGARDLELTGSGARVTAFASRAGSGGGGDIAINVDRLVLRDGADIDSGSVATAGTPGGDIRITAGQSVLLTGVKFLDASGILIPLGSQIATSSVNGAAGDLSIQTPDLQLRGGTLSSSTSLGRGGKITLAVDRLTMSDNGYNGSRVATDVDINLDNIPPSGNGGSVAIGAREAITIGDGPLPPLIPGGGPLRSGITSENSGSGLAGRLSLSTPSLSMTGGTRISSTTFGSGPAGDIDISAATVALRGGASIVAASAPNVSGDAGNITIAAQSVSLAEGGAVSNNTVGTGRSGSISIAASQALSVSGSDGTPNGQSGIFSQARGAQRGGAIALRAADIAVADGGTVSARNAGTGDAGSVDLVASSTVRLRDGASIATDAKQGGGGNIAIRAGQLVQLSSAGITTSVAGGTGSGGNILVDPRFVVLNHGTITANAVGGNGGNILINAGQYFASPDSVVQASSQLGINGTIAIQAPTSNITGSLAQLSGKFFDASAVRREGCATPARVEKSSSLVERGRGGLPDDGEGAQSARYFVDRSPATGVSGATLTSKPTGKPAVLVKISCR